MASPARQSTSDIQPLPSLPPSPIEEDLSRAPRWSNEEHTMSTGIQLNGSPPGASRKGKERESATYTEQVRTDSPAPYDEEEESRRVAENLKRWELAERQRRKQARESQSGGTLATPGIVSDINRRASLLWSSTTKRSSIRSSLGGVGKHVQLSSHETDGVPLEQMDSSNPVVIHSPSPTGWDRSGRRNPSENQNPFETEAEIDDENAVTAPNSPLPDDETVVPSVPSTPVPGTTDSLKGDMRSSQDSKPPPVKPIDIPPPKTPPPRMATPGLMNVFRSDEPAAADALTQPDPAEEQRKARWWTEWLCGCSEGTDRGGDFQAGRTNPFE